MGHNNERSSHSAHSAFKEEEYIDFFLNCDRASKTIYGATHIAQCFTPYFSYITKNPLLPTQVYGIDSSHLEQPLDMQTGSVSNFMSELMLVSTLSEVNISMEKFLHLEHIFFQTGTFPPADLANISTDEAFSFWFNGANLTPKNISKEEFRNPKNGFKVAVRDALKKPLATLQNPNKRGVIQSRNVSEQAKKYLMQNFRLIDALYSVFDHIDSTTWNKHIPHFSKKDNLTKSQLESPYFNLHILQCSNRLNCPDPICIKKKDLMLGQYDDTERFCPSCGEVICELDTIGLTDQYQPEMSNITLLSDITYFIEHLRCVQRLLCLPKKSEEDIAIVMDGTLGLFRKLQLVVPGIRSIVEQTLNHGHTVFGVVKHSATKDFFDYIDDLNPNGVKTIANGSFWIVRNRERYKYISPQFDNQLYHGQNTHYGVDVMVKTSRGYRFLVSVAIPEYIKNSSNAEYGSDAYLNYIQTNYQKIPSFVKMLATLEKMQMFLYGGSTIPQTLTHGQASISWDVSARVLAKSIAEERQKQMQEKK